MKLLSHDLIGIGPSCFARFMAGCVCEEEDSLYQAIEGFETKKIIATSQMKADLARDVAHKIVDTRRGIDENYKEADQLGIEGEGPMFKFTTDGDVYFPEFDDRLGEMYERQKVVRPEKYRKEEHDTVLSAYQALRNGANQAAHVVHQYNERGELDIRDIVILTYDHQTNTGRMHVLNISQEGKNHTTLESARDAMQKRLGGFEEKVKTDSVFLFIREQTPVDPVSLFREQSDKNSIRERKIIRLTPVQPAKEAVPQLRTVLNVDKDSHIPFRIPLFLQRLMGRDEKGELIQQKKQKEKKNKNVEKQKGTPSKETSSVVSRIEKQKQKVEKERRAIVVAEKTGVGIGGALFLLKKEAEQPPLRLTKKEKRFALRVAHKHLGKPDSSLSPKLSFVDKAKLFHTLGLQDSIDNAKLVKYKDLKRPKDKEIKRLRHKEIVHIIFPRKEKKRSVGSKEKRKKENSVLRAKELRLLVVLKTIRRKIRKEGIYAKGKQERKIIRPKESVQRLILEFTRAWILFMLFRHSYIDKQQHEKKENVIFIGKTNKEEKTIHESSPWILLSIIWYLTMIREQGKAVIIPKKKKKNKRRGKKQRKLLWTRYPQRISQQGIIYAYLF
jgi:hypothetical protein